MTGVNAVVFLLACLPLVRVGEQEKKTQGLFFPGIAVLRSGGYSAAVEITAEDVNNLGLAERRPG